MQYAQNTEKIQSGEAKVSSVRNQLEGTLGMHVDISVIKAGGAFDTPPYIPIEPSTQGSSLPNSSSNTYPYYSPVMVPDKDNNENN